MEINGKEIASKIFERLKRRVKKLRKKDIVPYLAVILIGNDPASISYVNQKEIRGKRIGVKITVKNLSKDVKENKLLAIIQKLNNNHNVHGIIAQRPLPPQIDSNKISQAIDPKKDVDGFHPNSKFQSPIALAVLGILEQVYQGSPPRSDFVPPRRWPNGLLRGEFRRWLSYQKIVVLGKGETGGKPVIDMLKKMGIQPLVIDSKTKEPMKLTKKADIIISAVGKPNVIKPEMIKKGVILIGVGLHKEEDGKLHGDYEEEKIKNIASFYTPTPGGVGPLNVAMLLENLVSAAENPK